MEKENDVPRSFVSSLYLFILDWLNDIICVEVLLKRFEAGIELMGIVNMPFKFC